MGRSGRGAAGRTKPRVVILGSGPNRIGQGIEFDYCCVHAAQAFRALGYEAVMVNCNPETVSTDYDTSDRLYFEPLGAEEVLEICARELPDGVVIQFGGQTPLKLARELETDGWRILGTPFDAVDLAEDRERFAALCDELDIDVPSWAMAEGAGAGGRRRGGDRLPGARPAVVRARRAQHAGLLRRRRRSPRRPRIGGRVLVDRFLEGAIEIDVDALCDGRETFVAAVMEHVEEAGVHSGDSSCVLPAPSLDDDDARADRGDGSSGSRLRSESSASSTSSSRSSEGEVFVLEANPRASRTVPFASKAIGVNLVEAACRLAAGARLSELGPVPGSDPATIQCQGGGASRSRASPAPTPCSGPRCARPAR